MGEGHIEIAGYEPSDRRFQAEIVIALAGVSGYNGRARFEIYTRETVLKQRRKCGDEKAMEKINVWVLLSVSLVITLTYSVLRNYFSKITVKTAADYYIFNAATSLISAAVLLALSGGFRAPSVFTLLLGTAFGVATALAAIFNLQAFGVGPMSYTTVILTASMIIPAISGRIFWNEEVGVFRYVGVFLMLVSITLSVNKKNGDKKSSFKWLALCLLGFLFNGVIGVMQKIHQSSEHSGELGEFLVIAFVVASAFSCGVYLWYKTVKKVEKSISFSPRFGTVWIAAVSGVCIALANQINLYLSGKMDSMIFFPIVNGGGLALATLAAVVLFRERLTAKQWTGIAIGTVSVLLLCGIV